VAVDRDMKGKLHVGTSGFTYEHWRDVFYPAEVPKRAWLEYYCEHFDTVEINSSYYHMPRGNVCDSWRRRTPKGFRFVMKLNGLITHRKRLIRCGEPLGAFLKAVDHLGRKLAAVLVQLPPRFRANADRLGDFLDICPGRYRWAVEFRDPSWLRRDIYAVLREHRAALVVHDLIPNHPRVLTADWTYLRFHGPTRRYGGCYRPQMLTAASGRIRKLLSDGLDVFAYFNNDAGGHAVRNAADLKRLATG